MTATATRARRRLVPSTLLERAREVERSTARLRLLCRLIARDRSPYCPVNGVVVAVPFDRARSESETETIGAACQQDLDTAEGVLQVGCPVLVVFTDLDRQQGFRELVATRPAGAAGDALGVDLPPIPDLRDEDVPGAIEGAVRWLAFRRLPSMLYPHWHFAPDPGPAPADVAPYEMLHAVQEGHGGLARVLVRGIYRGPRRLMKLAGVYLAGTGVRPEGRAFAPAAFRRALELQDHVSWTPAMIARDRLLRWRVAWGYLLIALWSAALIAAVVWGVGRLRGPSS